MTELTDEHIDALVNAVTDANPTANCETWSRLISRAVIAADRALRESSYTEQDVNGILNACSGAYYPMALEAVVRRTLGVPAP